MLATSPAVFVIDAASLLHDWATRIPDDTDDAGEVTTAWLSAAERCLHVSRVLRLESAFATPGIVLGAEGDSLWLSVDDGTLELTGFSDEDGAPVDATGALLALRAQVGMTLPPTDAALVEALGAFLAQSAEYESEWRNRLASLSPIELPVDAFEAESSLRPTRLMLAPSRDRDAVAASFIILLARVCGRTEFDLAFSEQGSLAAEPLLAALIATELPLRLSLSDAKTVTEAHAAVAASLQWVRSRGGFPRALAGSLVTAMPVAIAFVDRLEDRPVAVDSFTLIIARNGATAWDVNPARQSVTRVATLLRQFTASLAADSQSLWRELALMSATEQRLVLREWATPESVAAPSVCAHECIAEQAARTPQAIALVCGGAQMNYAELDARSNQLARHLQRLGAAPDTLVAVCCDRSIEMVVAILGVLKSGAAYVAIDPAFSLARVSQMLEDAQPRVLVTRQAALGRLPATEAVLVCLDRDWAEITRYSTEAPTSAVTLAHLAYCSYAPSVVGRPSGVLVEHRNLVSLFAAIDARLGASAGTWLATTSASMNGSVVELLWTLARGFTVIVQKDAVAPDTPELPNKHLAVDFSLFYGNAGEAEQGAEGYRAAIAGARFADEHGFAAVWTPERHFDATGSASPSPAISAAAIAAVTERVALRAGRLALPLQHSIRLAEEWAMVDRLSGGRAGIAVASEWQEDDFVLSPDQFADATTQTVQRIDELRRLWRGERVLFRGPNGEREVRTMPRPVQAELPLWITASDNPASVELAGRLGANVFAPTAPLTIAELREMVARYRESLRRHGHTAGGRFTLLLQALDDDGEATDESYAVAVDALKGAGVDEIAFDIDLSVDAAQLLGHLKRLSRVRVRTGAAQQAQLDDSLAALIERHAVTHLQCTPVVAQSLVDSPSGRAALGHLRTLCICGATLEPALAAELQGLVTGDVHTMYGPTETTSWAAAHTLNGERSGIPLGVPLANSELYVLDSFQQPVPPGTPGELFIGGSQVVRGYWRQPNLTAERFVPNPFRGDRSGRLYRTGDVVRWRSDGKLELVGRRPS